MRGPRFIVEICANGALYSWLFDDGSQCLDTIISALTNINRYLGMYIVH